jgi:hypothetical protein
LYDRDMLGEDIPGRFDYLFEPLDVAESAGDGDDTAPLALAPARPDNQNRWSNGILLAGIVLATMAATTAAVVALLQPAQPAQQTIIPTDATPVAPTTSTVVATVMPTMTAAPAPVSGATVSTSAIQPSAATPTVAQQRPPLPPPTTTTASKPAATMPLSPTTRAPISVSPESRAPFPNQTPQKGGDGHPGLLGGLL